MPVCLHIRFRLAASWGPIITCNLGKRLCELKDACRHGEFVQLAEGCCGLTKQHCNTLMRIYREFGQKESTLSFSTRALLELAKAPEPEVALAEATARKEAGENITAKQAREEAACSDGLSFEPVDSIK